MWMGVEIGSQKGLRVEVACWVGSRTSSQRIGTGGTPPRYQMAVPVVNSTMRLVRLYQRLTRWRCQETLGFFEDGGELFQGLASDRAAAGTFAFWRREIEQVGIEP
jgi:hypothetical protein